MSKSCREIVLTQTLAKLVDVINSVKPYMDTAIQESVPYIVRRNRLNEALQSANTELDFEAGLDAAEAQVKAST